MESCDCGGDMHMLVVNLAKELDYKNQRLLEVECNMEEMLITKQQLVEALKEQVVLKDKFLLEMKGKYHERCATINQMMNDKNRICEFMNEKDMLCRKYLEETQRLLSINGKLKSQKIFSTENEKKEELHSEIIQQEMKSDAVRFLELEIVQMKGTLDVMKHTEKGGELDVRKKMEEVLKELGEKEEELEDIQALNQTLIVKERESNDELQEARKVLITGLQDMLTKRSTLQIKQMGAIDPKPFQDICSEKFHNRDWGVMSAELCSTWEEKLRDTHWHPFKQDDSKGKPQAIIDEDDETLKGLRDEYGEAVHKAVADALLEMNEYNPSGRYTVPEVWKVKEGRKASLKEIIEFLMNRLKTQKRKRKLT